MPLAALCVHPTPHVVVVDVIHVSDEGVIRGIGRMVERRLLVGIPRPNPFAIVAVGSGWLPANNLG